MAAHAEEDKKPIEQAGSTQKESKVSTKTSTMEAELGKTVNWFVHATSPDLDVPAKISQVVNNFVHVKECRGILFSMRRRRHKTKIAITLANSLVSDNTECIFLTSGSRNLKHAIERSCEISPHMFLRSYAPVFLCCTETKKIDIALAKATEAKKFICVVVDEPWWLSQSIQDSLSTLDPRQSCVIGIGTQYHPTGTALEVQLDWNSIIPDPMVKDSSQWVRINVIHAHDESELIESANTLKKSALERKLQNRVHAFTPQLFRDAYS
jgi:hypothetical protein